MSTDELAAVDSYYRSKDFKDSLGKNYWNYVFNSCLQYLDTGDAKGLNHVIQASIVHSGTQRITLRCLKLVACHKLVNGLFKGRMPNKTAFKKRQDSKDKLKGVMQELLRTHFAEKEEKSNEWKPSVVENRVINALALLISHDEEVNMVELLVAAKKKAVTMEPLAAVPVVEVAA